MNGGGWASRGGRGVGGGVVVNEDFYDVVREARRSERFCCLLMDVLTRRRLKLCHSDITDNGT